MSVEENRENRERGSECLLKRIERREREEFEKGNIEVCEGS